MSLKVSFFLSKKRLKSGSHGEKTVNFWIFFIQKKKSEKNTFFWFPPINKTFFKKYEKWPLASKKSTKNGPKNWELHTWVCRFDQKMAIFRCFWNPLMLTTEKKNEKWPKNEHPFFFPIPRFFDFPSAGILMTSRRVVRRPFPFGWKKQQLLSLLIF